MKKLLRVVAVMAGAGWSNTTLPVFSYQLVFPGHDGEVMTSLISHGFVHAQFRD